MAQYFTDFSEYPVNQNAADWTPLFSSSNLNIREREDSISGQAARVTAAFGTHGSVWDVVTTTDDQEVVLVATIIDYRSTTRVSAMVRASGSANNETAYVATLHGDGNFHVEKFVSGTSTNITSAAPPFTPAADTWYVIRLRANGDQIQAKCWEPADHNDLSADEPTGWLIDVTDTDIATGQLGARWVREQFYLAFGAATNGDTAPIEEAGPVDVAARFILGLGTQAAAVQEHQIATRFGVGFQQRIGIDAELTPNEIAARFELGLAPLLTPEQEHQISARFGMGLGQSTSLAGGEVDVGARFVLGMGQELDLQIPTAVGARFGLGMGMPADAMSPNEIAARFEMAFGLREAYLGPGTGIDAGPQPNIIDTVRPGDSFPVHLPWAGLHGMSGLVRVLSVQIRDGQRTINAQFIPMPDEALIPGLAKGEPIRYTPPVQNDPWKLNRENQRSIRKLDRRR